MALVSDMLMISGQDNIMNHDGGFIIGIAHDFFFAKTLIERTPENHLEKYPSTKNNPLMVLCNEYKSTSKYQVKRKQQVYFI